MVFAGGGVVAMDIEVLDVHVEERLRGVVPVRSLPDAAAGVLQCYLNLGVRHGWASADDLERRTLRSATVSYRALFSVSVSGRLTALLSYVILNG